MSVIINGTNTPTAGGVTYGNGTEYATTTAGTSGQLLQSNGASAPSWVTFAAGTSITRTTKTASYTLLTTDKGNLVVATANSFTFSFTAAATLGSGWCVYLQNSGTGDITLDPNGSETIDGLTSYIMYPGEARLVQCDGTGFNSVVLNTFYRTFTSTGTFTKPPGYKQFGGLLWGGGGGGGKVGASDLNYGVGAGGGGACVPILYPSSSLSATETVTIGAGGNAAASGYVSAQAGGNSVFKGVTAYGGGGGWGDTTGNTQYGGGGGGALQAGATATAGGPFQGGSPTKYTGGNYASSGFGGATGGVGTDTVYGGGGGGGNGPGGNTIYGGAGGQAGYAQSGSFAAGTTIFGGAGGAFSVAGTAGSGVQPGGGGGATSTGTAGAGAAGQLNIWGVV